MELSAGTLTKRFAALGRFVFPVGDTRGTPEYSPVTLDFTGGTFTDHFSASVRVTNQPHPQGDQANYPSYLGRYWTVTRPASPVSPARPRSPTPAPTW